MPETPIAIQIPHVCEKCGRVGTVRLQQEITGEKIALNWHCAACFEEWPVRRKEEVPLST